MSAPVLRACVLAAAAAVEASRDELCRLDAGAGDGDHGVTMALAARAVRETLEASPDESGSNLISRLALAMGSVGGAIGPIYATGLLAVAKKAREHSDSDELTPATMAACANAAESAITALGGAKPGDKTILDALDPAVRSLHEAQASGISAGDALNLAAAAARRGADSTAQLAAIVGRASRLGERSRGLADPGASSLARILEAIAIEFGRASG